MARPRYSNMALTRDGRPVLIIPNATITLYDAGTTNALADTIYAGATGGATLTNPFWADTDGNYTFYLATPKSIRVKIDGSASGAGVYINDYEPVMPSADNILAADDAGLIDRSAIAGPVLSSQPTPLAGIGWALYGESQYGRIGLTSLRGGARGAAAGIYANYYGLISPPADHAPDVNVLTYTTPDAVNYGQVGAAYQLNVRRTGAGIKGLTMVSATSTSITVSGLAATLNQYVGWTIQIPSQITQLKVTSNAATGGGNTVLTGTAGWKPFSGSPATPTGTPSDVVLSYGSLHAFDGLGVAVDVDAHSVMPFATTPAIHGYVKMNPGSAGQGTGLMGQAITYSTEAAAIGGELDSQNLTKRMARYDGGVPDGHNYGQILGVGINLSDDPTTHRELVTATSFTATTIVFPAGTFTGQDWTGASVYVKVAATNAQQHRLVSSNTTTTLTLQGASWPGGTPTTPATVLLGSSYSSLYDRPGEVGGGGGALHNGGARIGRFYTSHAFGDLSFGRMFHPSSGVTWPDVIPNGTAYWAWEAAGSYETSLAGQYVPASQPWRPLIGLNSANETRIGVNAALRFMTASSGAWGVEIANLSTVGSLAISGNFSFNGGTANPVVLVHAATTTRVVTIQDLASQTMAALGAANAGHLLFADNTYDIGASGATRPRHLYTAGSVFPGQSLTGLRNLSTNASVAADGDAVLTDNAPLGFVWVFNNSTGAGRMVYSVDGGSVVDGFGSATIVAGSDSAAGTSTIRVFVTGGALKIRNRYATAQNISAVYLGQ